MNKLKEIIRPILPEVLMVVIMMAIALAYMSPVFEGKTLPQNDIYNARNMAHETQQFQKESGVYPGWTNATFGGMPVYQIKSPPSRNIFQILLRIFKLWLPGYTVAILFMAFAGFYLLLRLLKLNRWLALAGAIAFGLGSHHLQLIEAGHVSKIYAIAYLAPVIAGLLLVFNRKYLLGGLLSCIGLGIQIATNHVQVTYYLGIMVLIYFLVELVFAIREKYLDHWIKSGLILLAALVLAIIPNMTSLLTTAEYTQETTRGKNVLAEGQEGTQDQPAKSGLDLTYITDWSYGIGESLNLFIPNLYGGGSRTDVGTNSQFYKELSSRNIQNPRDLVKNAPTYWGSQYLGTSGPHYIGAITIFLAILGLFLVKGPRKWWLILVVILSLMLSWGRNFMVLTEFFVNNVPLYAKFRDVTNTLIIAQFALPLLAFLGIREWISQEMDSKDKLKKLYLATGIAGGIAMLFALIPGLAGSFTSPGDERYQEEWVADALRADRMMIARKDAFRTLIFVILAAGLLWASIKTKWGKEYLYVGLLLLVLVDLWSVGKRYLNSDDFESKRSIEAEFAQREADTPILKDTDPDFRVLDLSLGSPFQTSITSRFHKSLGGYHGAKLGRYQDVISRHLNSEIQAFTETLKEPSMTRINLTLAGLNTLNMLNTKYIILRPNMGPLKNEYHLGSVWFVDEVEFVPTAREELEGLSTFNPATRALVHAEFQTHLASLPKEMSPSPEPDSIWITEYKPNQLKYTSRAVDTRFAVFSEIWYPHGWKATIDGQSADIIRANYLLRGLVIPAGKHTIEFRFEPRSIQLGQWISLIGSILVLVSIGIVLFLKRRRA